MGLLCVGYIKAIKQVPEIWASYDNPGFPNDPATLTWVAGRPWWIGLGAGTGLVVGVLKAAMSLDEWTSFEAVLEARHVNFRMGVQVFVLCLIGIMGGETMGPEAGLGSIGSVIGQLVGLLLKRLGKGRFDDVDLREMTSAGAAAALAPLLASPFIAVLICAEVCNEVTSRGFALMLAGTMGSFAVYWVITPVPYLDPAQLTLYELSGRSLKPYDFAIAILLGASRRSLRRFQPSWKSERVAARGS